MASKNRLYLIKELESARRGAVKRGRGIRIRMGEACSIGLVFTKNGGLFFSNTCASNNILSDRVANLRFKTVR